jgi:hypothetical protein
VVGEHRDAVGKERAPGVEHELGCPAFQRMPLQRLDRLDHGFGLGGLRRQFEQARPDRSAGREPERAPELLHRRVDVPHLAVAVAQADALGRRVEHRVQLGEAVRERPLGALALEGATELGADRAHRVQHALVVRERLVGEEAEERDHLAADEHGHDHHRPEAGTLRGAVREVLEPRVLARLGDSCEELLRRGPPGGFDRPAEVGQGIGIVRVPERGHAGAFAVQADRLAAAPAHPRADQLQASRDGFVCAGGLVGGVCGLVQQLGEPHLLLEHRLGAALLEDGDRLAAKGLERAALLIGELARDPV